MKCKQKSCPRDAVSGRTMCQKHIEYFAEWRKNRTPEKRIGQCKKWSCPRDAVDGRNYCQKHIDYQSEYGKRNRETLNKKTKIRVDRYREMTFDHYGGKCSSCGHSNRLHLILHHVNHDGGKQRAENKNLVGRKMYVHFVNNGYPDDLELLCANCHLEHHRLT
jgi:hypothetical protein